MGVSIFVSKNFFNSYVVPFSAAPRKHSYPASIDFFSLFSPKTLAVPLTSGAKSRLGNRVVGPPVLRPACRFRKTALHFSLFSPKTLAVPFSSGTTSRLRNKHHRSSGAPASGLFPARWVLGMLLVSISVVCSANLTGFFWAFWAVKLLLSRQRISGHSTLISSISPAIVVCVSSISPALHCGASSFCFLLLFVCHCLFASVCLPLAAL